MFDETPQALHRVATTVPAVVHETLRRMARRSGLPVAALAEEALREWPPLRRELERAEVVTR